LLPPTDKDLQGIVCIYANTPLWEPKKIRYRYPGENWQEIAGDRYTLEPITTVIRGGETFTRWTIASLKVNVVKEGWKWEGQRRVRNGVFSSFDLTFNSQYSFTGTFLSWNWDKSPPDITFTAFIDGPVLSYAILSIRHLNNLNQIVNSINFAEWTGSQRHQGWFVSRRLIELHFRDDQFFIPPAKDASCVFKVFNVFNQEILSITRDVCPEVIVVPERCYYKAENERLVRRVIVGFLKNLRTEYNGNCVTVWLDALTLPFATEIYKECSDNPSCPPPRIRFDKKCEEKCEQCPPGTAIKVLLGGNIACVDSVGCILKTVKFKPGCNNYDCICN
jgi:hypothetical protein